MQAGRGKCEEWPIVKLGPTHTTEDEPGPGCWDDAVGACQKVQDKQQKFSSAKSPMNKVSDHGWERL
jgi:hypothetical protein